MLVICTLYKAAPVLSAQGERVVSTDASSYSETRRSMTR